MSADARDLHVRGVTRVADEPRALLVALSDTLTDDELRAFHEFLRQWRGGGRIEQEVGNA